jgi:hypothetical protein
MLISEVLMDIKEKILQVSSRLTWWIEHEMGGGDLEITSNPWRRTHTIKMPSSGSEWRPIEYLHELAHAMLAERHHLLSTAYFVRGVSQEEITPLVNPCRVASDWFADALLMLWCPTEEAAEIREHVAYAIRYDGDDLDMLYGGGLMLAQAVRYLDLRKEEVPERYRSVMEVLLSTPLEAPTVSVKRKIINELASLSCSSRVHLTREEGMDVWRIKKTGGNK